MKRDSMKLRILLYNILVVSLALVSFVLAILALVTKSPSAKGHTELSSHSYGSFS